MKKEEKLIKSEKVEINEKRELKDIEMQADPCKGNGHKPCRYNCCNDCHDNTDSWQSMYL